MNKEEFITCGVIPHPEVDLKTMKSRRVPGLFLAGEALDIDGITGEAAPSTANGFEYAPFASTPSPLSLI